VFSAIVLRPALALVDDRTLASTIGRVHDFADWRLRVPGVARHCAAIAGTVAAARVGHWEAMIAGAIAVTALAIWLIIYIRINASINRQLTAASHHGETPFDVRILQQRWDSVITARSPLQMLAIRALCTMLMLR
jgi:hypothetical protein